MSDIIYHYCSLDVFHQIITNQELWLTDSEKMNDPTEGAIYSTLLSQKIDKNLIDSVEKIRKDFKFFITCFSSQLSLLPQWVMYADDGNGVAIGFNRQKLGLLPHPTIPISKEMFIYPFQGKVRYNEEERKDLLNYIIDKLENFKKNLDSHDLSDDGLIKAQSDFLMPFSYLIKDIIYEHENEYRIIFPIQWTTHDVLKSKLPKQGRKNPHSQKNEKYTYGVGDLKYHTKKKHFLTPYFPFKFDKSAVQDIRMIKGKSKTTQEEVEFFLKVNNYENVTVSCEDIPYR